MLSHNPNKVCEKQRKKERKGTYKTHRQIKIKEA
jgi:hypothetical protein